MNKGTSIENIKTLKKTAAPEGDLMPRASLASSVKFQASLYIISLII